MYLVASHHARMVCHPWIYLRDCSIFSDREGLCRVVCKNPSNPAVAVKFKPIGGDRKVIFCDRFKFVHDNLLEVAELLSEVATDAYPREAEKRGIEQPAWHEVLGVDRSASIVEIRNAYYGLAQPYTFGETRKSRLSAKDVKSALDKLAIAYDAAKKSIQHKELTQALYYYAA
jgi:preprotein translocase subunit Sec63